MKNLFLLFTIFSFMACNSKTQLPDSAVTTKNNSTTTTSKEIDKSIDALSDNVAIMVHQETCRGYCPGFTFTIFESGKVDYFGQRNVDKLGNHISTMTNKQLKSLIAMEEKIGFKKMEDIYFDNKIADLPATTVTCGSKQIKYQEFKAPAELKEFVEKLNATLEELTWEKID